MKFLRFGKQFAKVIIFTKYSQKNYAKTIDKKAVSW